MDNQIIFNQPSSSMDWSRTNLVTFPEEKICDIFSYLSVSQLRATVFVCKQWSRISSELLTKADNLEYEKTQESIEILIRHLYTEARKCSPTARSLEELLSKNSHEITFSFALKRQAVKVLAEGTGVTGLGAATTESYDDHKAFLCTSFKNKLAQDLRDIVFNIYNFACWRNEKLNGKMIGILDIPLKKMHGICLELIKLSDFDRATKYALEIKSDSVEFSQQAETLKEEVFANLAMALTKQGYMEKALEILDKDIYPGSPEKNLKYKSYVWTFISPELNKLNYNYQ